MRRVLAALLLLLTYGAVHAQTPVVGRVTSDPAGRACTAPPTYNTWPVLMWNTGTTVNFYYCSSFTSQYVLLSVGGGAVSSVFGRTGDVTAATSDYDAVQVDNTPAGSIAATNVQTAIDELASEKQPLDNFLTALDALATTGIVARTGPSTGGAAARTITGTTNEIEIQDGNGVSGNPTIGIPTNPTLTGNVTLDSCTMLDGAILCDANNNGVTDWAYVGDYDDDGTLEMTDIDTVANAMTEGGTLTVAPGTYQPELDITNTKGVIELRSNTRLLCAKGAILKGPLTYAGTDGGTGTSTVLVPSPSQNWTTNALVGFTAYSATDNNGCTITSNDANSATCTTPKASGTFAGDTFWVTRTADDQPVVSNKTTTGAGDHDISVVGCEIDGGMPPTGYNPTGLDVGRIGISFTRTARWGAERNFVHDTRHTGIYSKDSTEGKVLANDVLRVGNWQAATGGNAATVFPCFYLFANEAASGTHNGSGNAATLSDSGASFPLRADGTGELVGHFVVNSTDSSACKITANTATTITCTLAGGTDNDWDASDAYSVGGLSGRNTISDNTCEKYGSGGLSTRNNAVQDQVKDFVFSRNIMTGQGDSDIAECLVIAGVESGMYADNKCVNTGSVLLSPVATGWFTSGDGGMKSDPANTRNVVIDGLQMSGCNGHCVNLGANHENPVLRNVTIQTPDVDKRCVTIANPMRNGLIENVECIGVTYSATANTAGLVMTNAQTVANNDEQWTIRNWYGTHTGTSASGMLFLAASRGLTIENARFYNVGGTATAATVQFAGATEGLRVSGLICNQGGSSSDCVRHTVSGNNHLSYTGLRQENSGTGAYALYFTASSGTSTGVVLTDVTAYGHGASGVGGAVRTTSGQAVLGSASNIKCTNKGGNPCFFDSTSDTWFKSNVDGEGPIASYTWTPKMLDVDGTQCVVGAAAQLNSGPLISAITCAKNAAGAIYGQVTMPDGYDGGTVTFELSTYHATTETITFAGDFSAQCRGATETVSSTWGTAVADDVAITTAHRIEHATTAAVTPAGTCAAGDTMYWRWVEDEPNFSTNAANTKVQAVKMEYTTTGND